MVKWPKWGRREDQASQLPPPVVHFTAAAEQQVLALFERTGAPERAALRISAQTPPFGPPSYGMALEEAGEPGPDDVLLTQGGIRVLVDAASLAEVDGATVDFVDDLLRPGFSIHPPGRAGSPPPPPRSDLDLSDPLTAAVQAVIEQHINPGIAGHGGRASLVAVKDAVAYVELGGGCQGCAMAAVTLKQGVEQMIRAAVPQIREVVDVTDHAGGDNPYFTSAKGGESPFYQAAKG